jgi:predicted nucleotidyltransferase
VALLRKMRNDIRRMRTSPILDALFPKVRGQILSAMFVQPEREWYLSELAHFLNTRPSSLQREVEALSKAGILSQRRDATRRMYLQPATSSPVYSELKGLLEKTAGIVPVLKQELGSLEDKLQTAFVYGSMARAEEHSDSDIDLMLIGNIGMADTIPALRKAERRLGRPINPTVFSQAEFKKKVRQHDHFLTTVLKGAKYFVKGNESELVSTSG